MDSGDCLLGSDGRYLLKSHKCLLFKPLTKWRCENAACSFTPCCLLQRVQSTYPKHTVVQSHRRLWGGNTKSTSRSMKGTAAIFISYFAQSKSRQPLKFLSRLLTDVIDPIKQPINCTQHRLIGNLVLEAVKWGYYEGAWDKVWVKMCARWVWRKP